MLTDLTVHNLLIVQQARLCPGEGLTVVSGETGAGKSLLLDALGLLLGGRAQGTLVGPHGDAVTIAGTFSPGAASVTVTRALDAAGIVASDGQVILRRRVGTNGRSQAWINDTPVTVALLKQIGDLLVEIRAQHDMLRLNQPAHQLDLLDGFAHIADDALAYRAVHQRCLDLAQRLTALDHGERESLRERDYLRFQADELTALAPRAGELPLLEQRHRALSGGAEYQRLAAEAAELLGEGDRSVTRTLSTLARRLAEAPDAELLQAGSDCRQALEAATDAAARCAAAIDRLGADPVELARVEARIDAYHQAMRKHGEGEVAVLEAWRQIDERLRELDGLGERRAALARDLDTSQRERTTRGAALAKARAAAFTKLAKAVHRELDDLGMPKARLSLDEEVLSEPTALGTVRQEFLVCTNPGLPSAPISAVASGGEIARLTLALATVLAEVDATPVLVFDEVDSGVGGRLGAVIGAKLARLGRGRTVLAITHTPHVAAAAHRHYAVRKLQSSNHTAATVEEIVGEHRASEIAEMLGGGSAARAQAKALIAEARA